VTATTTTTPSNPTLIPSPLLLAMYTFISILLSFLVVYHMLAPLYSTPKQLSWVLTSVASAGMTIASLPFMWDYLTSGGNVQSVRTLPVLSLAVNRFFQAYLTADLMMGAAYYRAQVALVTGWIHHIVYILIVEMAIRCSWAHIFCLCASMELPTFILAISSLYPRLRSNVVFALAFFATRIMLHIVLCISYLFPKNREHATKGSFVPSILLACIFPLHALWFRGCINGFIKRARARNAPSAVPLEASPSTSPLDKDLLLDSSSDSYEETCSQAPVTPPSRTLPHPRGRLFKRAIRIQVDAAMQHLAEARRGLYGSLPRRDVVFEFVGLSPSVAA